MCDLVLNNILGFVVGVAASFVVSAYFYRRGSHDAKRLHLASQVDTIVHVLARCDHTQRGSGRRGDDGLEPTAHWLLCMVDVLQRSGSRKQAKTLESVAKDILAAIETFDQSSDAERGARKKTWQATVGSLAK